MFYLALSCLVSSPVVSLSKPTSLRLLGVKLCVLGLPGLAFAPSSFAAPVTLEWTASPDPQLAGHKVHYGYASRQYDAAVDVGTSTMATFSNLEDAQIYYFTVTAYDATGQESTYSNEVSYDLAKVDTDKDGLSNWDELSFYKTDPNLRDTDGDGLDDGDEVTLYQTDPTKADTDGDGIRDGVEANPGANPLNPTPIPSSGSVVFAVNAGGPQYAASSGSNYLADSRFNGGTTYRTTAAIAGTTDPTLYQSERHGDFSYAVPVENGDYVVILRFAEVYWSDIGQRVFDVEIEGSLEIDQLDLIAEVGQNVAYDVAVSAHVTDGTLDITFRSVVDFAKVSAIEISQADESLHN